MDETISMRKHALFSMKILGSLQSKIVFNHDFMRLNWMFELFSKNKFRLYICVHVLGLTNSIELVLAVAEWYTIIYDLSLSFYLSFFCLYLVYWSFNLFPSIYISDHRSICLYKHTYIYIFLYIDVTYNHQGPGQQVDRGDGASEGRRRLRPGEQLEESAIPKAWEDGATQSAEQPQLRDSGRRHQN